MQASTPQPSMITPDTAGAFSYPREKGGGWTPTVSTSTFLAPCLNALEAGCLGLREWACLFGTCDAARQWARMSSEWKSRIDTTSLLLLHHEPDKKFRRNFFALSLSLSRRAIISAASSSQDPSELSTFRPVNHDRPWRLPSQKPSLLRATRSYVGPPPSWPREPDFTYSR